MLTTAPSTVNITPWTTAHAFHTQPETPWGRRPLPCVPNCDGRPIWEPPCLDYSSAIDEEAYQKKRHALLKYFNGDVVKVTEVMDILAELDIVNNYYSWVQQNLETTTDGGTYEFFGDLYRRLKGDLSELWAVFAEFNVILTAREDCDGNHELVFKFIDWKALEAEEAEERKAMEAEFAREQREQDLQSQPLAMRLVALRRSSALSSNSQSFVEAPQGSDLD